MKREEFIKKCQLRGYGSAYQAKEWMQAHPKAEYTEEDLESMVDFNSRVEWTSKGVNRKDRYDERTDSIEK